MFYMLFPGGVIAEGRPQSPPSPPRGPAATGQISPGFPQQQEKIKIKNAPR